MKREVQTSSHADVSVRVGVGKGYTSQRAWCHEDVTVPSLQGHALMAVSRSIIDDLRFTVVVWRGTVSGVAAVLGTRFPRVTTMEFCHEFGGVREVGGRYPRILLGGSFIPSPLHVVQQGILPPTVDLGVKYFRHLKFELTVDLDGRRRRVTAFQDATGVCQL